MPFAPHQGIEEGGFLQTIPLAIQRVQTVTITVQSLPELG